MNELNGETSLYLRQHADNPVNWQPWCDDALSEARERDLPILLSIGYSACHWCHVMAHESFEDIETAEQMNSLFVNIKVDREERPDLDRIYQLSHQLLTGRGGGWPLTVFLEPVELIPFFAGTYFPRERRYGMPAFKELLAALHQWYRENRDDVRKQNQSLRKALAAIQNPPADKRDGPDAETVQNVLQSAARQITARFDSTSGGYGGAPKFPQAPLLNAVALLGSVEEGQSLLESLEFTLERMANSGLRDHLDGGFFRYCVDEHWTIPHFEKMLYDNAMLLPLYAEGARRWSNPVLEEAAEGIAGWLDQVMKQDSGGYAASIDADADGEEGGFHVWRRDQVEAVLEAEDTGLFYRAYGLDGPQNFEGEAWHLQRKIKDSELAAEFGLRTEVVATKLARARQALRGARSHRVHPTLDNKQLTSWNALLAEGLTRAGRALDREEWLDRAAGIFRFIQEKLWTGAGLLAVHNSGQARFEAYLDDYAWLLNALTLHLQTRWDPDWLRFSVEVADSMLLRFEDTAEGGFFFSDVNVEVPIMRSMTFHDDATPAGNAVAILALNRLGRLLGDPRYTVAADRAMRRGMEQLENSPLACPGMLTALHDCVLPPRHVVIAGTDPAEQNELKRWVECHDRLDCYLVSPMDNSLPGVLGQYCTGDPVTAWLCLGMQCLPPVNSRAELERLLEK